MTTNETSIKFIKLEFKEEILKEFEPYKLNYKTNIALGQFVLCMSWPWRAPDQEDFNSNYYIPAQDVIKDEVSPIIDTSGYISEYIHNLSLTQNGIEIPPDKQLRIRTIALGISTIRFFLKKDKKILGQASLDFPPNKAGQIFISLENDAGMEIAKEIAKLELSITH